jgi:hypothetical protein
MAELISVLKAVNDAAMEIGIRQTMLDQAIGSADEDVVQMTALLSAVADDVLLDEYYQDLLGDGHWLVDKTGIFKTQPTSDDDRILFDSRIAITGLKYKFLQAKGLEFGEQMRDFTVRLNKLAVRVNNRVLDLNLDQGRQV